MLIVDFELVVLCKSTVNELSVALCYADGCSCSRDNLAQSMKIRSVRISVVCTFLPVVTLIHSVEWYLFSQPLTYGGERQTWVETQLIEQCIN